MVTKMGFVYNTVRKGVYADGHERKDVVDYRTNIFIPKWKQYQRLFVEFKEDGTWSAPILYVGEKPLVLITYDESIFNANDGKRKLWMKKGK